MNKKWLVLPKINEENKNQFPEINPVILQLLFNRQLTTQRQIDAFLQPDYSKDLHDPFLFKDMNKAVDRIDQAIKQKEKILIYSDYDVDGVTSATILKTTLEKLGVEAEQLTVYLPDRAKEGYGMRTGPVQEAAQNGVKLIITCDLGITNMEEVDLANKLGMEVILTDHHLPLKEVPSALAILDPHYDQNYPCKYLAGVGVVFKLIQALLLHQATQDSEFIFEAFEKWLLDLVALGTVSDLMVLLDENRTLVKYGLIVLNKTNRLGLKTLIQESNLTLGAIDTRTISFQISPRLNVASRMDHANTALALLSANDLTEAIKISQDLNRINSERQKLVELALQELKKDFGENPSEKIIITFSQKWPPGVLGLIAGRLREEYQRPALVMTEQDRGLVGNGRSDETLNLVELFEEAKDFLSRYGGHRKAAGFAIDQLNKKDKFIKRIKEIANQKISTEIIKEELLIDAEIGLTDINWELEEKVEQFAPFGEGNRSPLFLVKNLVIDNIQWVGQNNKHLKLIASGRKFIHFCADNHCKNLKIGDAFDAVVEIGVNQWNGTKELQIKIIELEIK